MFNLNLVALLFSQTKYRNNEYIIFHIFHIFISFFEAVIPFIYVFAKLINCMFATLHFVNRKISSIKQQTLTKWLTKSDDWIFPARIISLCMTDSLSTMYMIVNKCTQKWQQIEDGEYTFYMRNTIWGISNTVPKV